MVIDNLLDHDLGHTRSVDAAVVKSGHWIMVWLEREAELSPQVDGKLASSIPMQLMAVAWHPLHVLECRSPHD